MLHIFLDDILQMTFPKDEHSVHTLTFDTSDKPFNHTIQMRSHRQGADGLDTRVLEDMSKLLGKEGVSVMDDILFILQEA